ncbi:glycosyltransferase family 2 protein [Winogradskyella forsetii]|uniref:glycosyltransferase family 2 protein n=1 Tax=Winogradskyella forsetii TaxID=2686077 RepID=UPI0015BA9E55|nr:glycosyltransferase family A protein [Winogradskyella forsetii]
MIVLLHNENKVIRVYNTEGLNAIEISTHLSIIRVLYDLAETFPNNVLVWSHISHEKAINFHKIENTIVLKNEMCSFSTVPYLPDAIGYVDQSPFISVNRKVKYPTWVMSSQIGAIHASQMIKFKTIVEDNDFGYALNSIAKLGMPRGLFCYSEPGLFINDTNIINQRASIGTLFKFVKQHYKIQWIFFLFLTYLWYEKRIKIIGLIMSLFYSHRYFQEVIEPVPNSNGSLQIEKPSMDVVIPTIGRKKFLYDVLQDLRHQTVLPNRVIIIEQNPLEDSNSELDYLTTETWPFIIDHTFTHQAGACNARNIAINKVTSDWLFFADDDIRIEKGFVESVFYNLKKYNANACVLSCLLEGQIQTYTEFHQTSIFGSGCSVVKTNFAKKVDFDEKLEFGFGEDYLYGLELRNNGANVVYFPSPAIIHLKASIGGFRTKYVQPWENEKIQPKPSPTIMYVNLKYKTVTQLLGSKALLFLKMFARTELSKKVTLYKQFNLRWKASKSWAKKL